MWLRPSTSLHLHFATFVGIGGIASHRRIGRPVPKRLSVHRYITCCCESSLSASRPPRPHLHIHSCTATMRTLTASRRLVRSRPLSTISSFALTRYDGPVSSMAPPNFTHGRLADHNICQNYNQRFLTSTSASEGNDDDISIKSQATADDVLLSKYTQITKGILKSTTGSISDKLRH